ncbi:unnamed protein product [Camellia sinensis]
MQNTSSVSSRRDLLSARGSNWDDEWHSVSEHKYEIVKRLQERKHICGMTGDGVNDAPALKKADIGIAVADATHAARGASDIVLTEPGLSVIISAVLTSRAIFQRMKNYTIYAVSITIHIVSYTYSGEASEEFDRDDNTLTLIKPSPMPSKDIRSPLEVGSVHGGNNGVWNVDLEENKIE